MVTVTERVCCNGYTNISGRCQREFDFLNSIVSTIPVVEMVCLRGLDRVECGDEKAISHR